MSPSARARRRIEISRIRVRFIAEGAEGVGQLRNVSRAGLFVCTDEMPRVGAPVVLQFEPPGGDTVSLRGEVRWIHSGEEPSEPRGFGISLCEPSREYREFYFLTTELLEKGDE